MTIRERVQGILDGALSTAGIHSFWLRKSDIAETTNEYVVYTVNFDSPDIGADGTIIVNESTAMIHYFCVEGMAKSTAGIGIIEDRLSTIRRAFVAADFDVSGWKDVGDVDGIFYNAFVLEVSYKEVIAIEN